MSSSTAGEVSVNLSRLLLAACIAIANSLCLVCVLPPNPEAESTPREGVKDNLRIPLSLSRVNYVSYAGHAVATILHGVVIYTYPAPPKAVCPQSSFASLSDPAVFVWNLKLAAALLAIAAGAAVRIAAFRNLGANFTFNLKQPSGLVKTGVHRYMQHPSYTGLVPVLCCTLYLYARPDGLAACFLPPGWIHSLSTLQPFFVATVVLALSTAVWTRVSQEEGMLRQTFGKEWEDYHRTTKRFVPGVL